MIYILANNYREADNWAVCYSDPPLTPREWTFISTLQDLRGHRDITIVVYSVHSNWHSTRLALLHEVEHLVRDGVYKWTLKYTRERE